MAERISKQIEEKKPKALRHAKADTKVNKLEKRLELLVTVVNKGKEDFYQDLLQSFEVNMQLALRARGTASRQMLSLLGLEENAKTVIFSLIREDRLSDALAALSEKFATIKNGGGIAYTLPLSSVIGVAIYGFLSNDSRTVKED